MEGLHASIRVCTRCGLHATRVNAVPGTGPVPSDVMIVGEAPGFNEDVQGRPFVGPAGRLLDTLLVRIGLSRERVFITNVLKCRPPQNRDPLPTEAEACMPYLRRQFKLVQPRAVLVLGNHAVQQMLPGAGAISSVHGRLFERMGVAFMPCYHPAAALHNAALLQDLEADFDRVRAYLHKAAQAPPDGARDPGPAGEQLSPGEQLRLL